MQAVAAVEELRSFESEAGDGCAGFTLDTFPADDVPGRAALKVARAWLERGASGLYILGATRHRQDGTRLRDRPRGHHPEPVTLRGSSTCAPCSPQLRLDIAEGETPDVREKVAADLLVLDDLGAERPTAWAVETISTLVEDFFRDAGRTMIVTTNYSPAQLATRLSPPDDPIAGQRIVSRLVQHTYAVHLDRADLRAAAEPGESGVAPSRGRGRRVVSGRPRIDGFWKRRRMVRAPRAEWPPFGPTAPLAERTRDARARAARPRARDHEGRGGRRDHPQPRGRRRGGARGVNGRPPLSVLLADPGSVVLRTDLLRAGWPERLVDALFQRVRTEGAGLRAAVRARGRRDTGAKSCRRKSKVIQLLGFTVRCPRHTSPRRGGVALSSSRAAKGRSRRFLVRYRLGGREAKIEYAGSFKRQVGGGAPSQHGRRAARRRARQGDPHPAELHRHQTRHRHRGGAGWLRSRLDITPHTVRIHGDSLRRLDPLIGTIPIDELTVDDVTNAIATLAESFKPSTVRKSLNCLQQALDHAQLDPNVARDRRIRLPRQKRVQISPPETEHVEAVIRALPARYRLPVLALDATGMRISELVGLTWGDVDEPAGRWRVRPDTSKTGDAPLGRPDRPGHPCGGLRSNAP